MFSTKLINLYNNMSTLVNYSIISAIISLAFASAAPILSILLVLITFNKHKNWC